MISIIYTMYGAGSKPVEIVNMLAELGFTAIVAGVEAIEAANSKGMEVYVCSSAYSASGQFAADEYLARDVNGRPQLWFGSTCPTNAGVRGQNLENICNMARTKGIKGIIIDGARFASPASSNDPDAFFTCFCPGCEKKAKDMGFDFIRMYKAVKALYDFLNGENIKITDYIQGISDWFEFRRAATTEHLVNITKTVKEVNSSLLTGIYIFTPSLSALVGQNYTDLLNYMDFFAPMIYRNYKAVEGPACLNHELQCIVRLVEKAPWPGRDRIIKLISVLTGLDLYGYTSSAQILAGLPVQAVYNETVKARAMIGNSARLAPIIQLDDEMLEESIKAVEKGGADEIHFFVYKDEYMKDAKPVFKKLIYG